MNRILIIQTAFLGDVILATPVIAELYRLFPKAQIDVLVKKGNESLLQGNPKLNRVYTFDKSKGKYKAIFKLIRSIRREQYDLVLNLHRFASSGIIAGRSGAKKRYGFQKNPLSFLFTKRFPHVIGDGTHEVTRNLSLIEEFGASHLIRPELFPSEEDFAVVKKFQSVPYICIAPASVWFTKQLPENKWVELLKQHPTTKVFVLGGPGDASLAERILSQAPEIQGENVCGKLSLLQSAALMKGAQRNFVNDSGPLHLASSQNAPVTAFFCSTVPDFGFGPLSEDADIKQVEGLECRPCGLHGRTDCPQGHFKCGKDLVL